MLASAVLEMRPLWLQSQEWSPPQARAPQLCMEPLAVTAGPQGIFSCHLTVSELSFHKQSLQSCFISSCQTGVCVHCGVFRFKLVFMAPLGLHPEELPGLHLKKGEQGASIKGLVALQFLHLVISQIFVESLILNGYSGSGDTVVDENVNPDFLGIFLVRYATETSQQAVNQKRGVTGYGMSTEDAELPQRGVSPLTSFTVLVTCCLVVVLCVYVFFFSEL